MPAYTLQYHRGNYRMFIKRQVRTCIVPEIERGANTCDLLISLRFGEFMMHANMTQISGILAAPERLMSH